MIVKLASVKGERWCYSETEAGVKLTQIFIKTLNLPLEIRPFGLIRYLSINFWRPS